jgi:DNA-binding transcriptional ArsR family regulator
MSVQSIDEPPRANSEDARGVLDKAIDLLDVLAEGRDMTAAELAERTGQPRSSVYRLLMTLRQRGFVESGPHRSSFRLGLEFLHLGGVVMSRFDVRQAAQPVMERLHATTGETIYLCVRSGNQSVCIAHRWKVCPSGRAAARRDSPSACRGQFSHSARVPSGARVARLCRAAGPRSLHCKHGGGA